MDHVGSRSERIARWQAKIVGARLMIAASLECESCAGGSTGDDGRPLYWKSSAATMSCPTRNDVQTRDGRSAAPVENLAACCGMLQEGECDYGVARPGSICDLISSRDNYLESGACDCAGCRYVADGWRALHGQATALRPEHEHIILVMWPLHGSSWVQISEALISTHPRLPR